jgi:hypothetical protein
MWKPFSPLLKRCNDFASAEKGLFTAIGCRIVLLGQKLDSTARN